MEKVLLGVMMVVTAVSLGRVLSLRPQPSEPDVIYYSAEESRPRSGLGMGCFPMLIAAVLLFAVLWMI